MITVKVFGTTPPCATCKEMERRARNVPEKYPGQVTVNKFDALSEEGDKYSVMLTLTIVANGKVVAVSQLNSKDKLEEIVKKELEVS